MTNSRNVVLSALVCVAAIIQTPTSRAQDVRAAVPPASRSRPIPKVDYVVPWMQLKIFGLNAESNRPDQNGVATAPTNERRYYYLPLFCFQSSVAGKVDIAFDDLGNVRLPMTFDNEAARKAVRTYLIEQRLIPQEATEGQVQTVGANSWYLETAHGYEPKVQFGPYYDFLFPNESQLHTKLAPEKAKKFAADLAAGKVTMQATIVFEGYTSQDISLVISSDDILNTEQYRQLKGQGGEGKAGRHQIAKVLREACLTRRINITTEYDDPDFNELIELIVRNYSATVPVDVKAEDFEKVEAFFKESGWDPNDLKADLIESNKHNESKEARDQFSSDITEHFGHDGNVGWGVLAIKGDWKYDTNKK